MSKSPHQHWQQDNQEYTFNQYSFYLILLGLLLAGLLAWWIWNLSPPPRSQTHLLSITSKTGGDLPAIPFRDEDSESLSATFPLYKRYQFDERESFERVIEKIQTDFRTNQDIDTMIIWLSGIGSVRDGRPVILTSDPAVWIEFDDLLTALNQLVGSEVVLLLDCGYAYVDPTTYENGASQTNTDFNSFVESVQNKFTRAPEAGKVQLLINGRTGERPLHSITRRRSLFGLALEQTLNDRNQTKWTVDDLRTRLDEFSLSEGGTIAPSIIRLGNQEVATEFLPPPRVASEEPAEPELGNETPVPAMPLLSPTAEKLTKELEKTWQKIEEKFLASSFIGPAVSQPVPWSNIINDAIGMSASQLESELLPAAIENIGLELVDIRDEKNPMVAGQIKRLYLNPDPDMPNEPIWMAEKREIAQAYLQTADLQCRLPHYVALADQLLWLFPTDNAVEKYHSSVIELIQRLRELSPVDSSPFLPLKIAPTLDNLQEIRFATSRLNATEQRLRSYLKNCCDKLDNISGFQREMAIEAVLKLPFLASNLPAADNPERDSSDRIPSRAELRDYLLQPNPSNEAARIEIGNRQQGATKRIEMYRQMSQWIQPASRRANDLSSRLQTAAYRFAVPPFNLDEFSVADRTLKPNVTVRNRAALIATPTFIELEPTNIGLDLQVENAEVVVRCRLIQNGSFFEFPGESSSQSKDQANFSYLPASDQQWQPKLIALTQSPQVDPGCLLEIEVVDSQDPNVQYDKFDIPIRLPSTDAVDLLVNVGRDSETFRAGVIGNPLRTYPNRTDFSCTFELRNHSHKPQSGTLKIYVCLPPTMPTIPGKINDEVQRNSIQAYDRNELTPIAGTEPLTLAPNRSSDSSGARPKTPEAIPIQWKKPVESPEMAGTIVANHGLLCVFDRGDTIQPWYYWVPIFPEQNPVADVRAEVRSDDLYLVVKRQTLFPEDRTISLKWNFSDQQNDGNFTLADMRDRDECLVVRNVSALKANLYLYVDVDDWPRKYVFQLVGNQFIPATTFNAKTYLRLATTDDSPADGLIDLEVNEQRRVRGTRSEKRDLEMIFQPNVPANNRFLFTTAEDFIALLENSNEQRLFYPRKIEHIVALNEKTGKLSLDTRVSDHQLVLRNVSNPMVVAPVLHFGDQSILLDGQQHKIMFDNDDPKISKVKVNSKLSSQLGENVRIQVVAQDDGVGVDWRKTEIYLSLPDRSLTKLSGEPVPSKWLRSGSFELAPEKTGEFAIGVRVYDRVGNLDERIQGKFEIVPVPKPTVVKDDEKRAALPPKTLTHQIVVSVNAAGANNAANVSGLVLTIDPPDAKAEKVGENYVFNDLKGNTPYTVTASGKFKSGLLKGNELSATDNYRFPEQATRSESASMKLTLKPK